MMSNSLKLASKLLVEKGYTYIHVDSVKRLIDYWLCDRFEARKRNIPWNALDSPLADVGPP